MSLKERNKSNRRNTNIGGDIPYSMMLIQVMFLISWLTESNTAWSFWDNVYTAHGPLWPTDVEQVVANFERSTPIILNGYCIIISLSKLFEKENSRIFFQPSFFYLAP